MINYRDFVNYGHDDSVFHLVPESGLQLCPLKQAAGGVIHEAGLYLICADQHRSSSMCDILELGEGKQHLRCI